MILKYLHESSARCRPTFVPRHAEHFTLDFEVDAAGVVSDTLSHEHHRLQNAGWIRRFVGQEDNSASVTGYHRGCPVHAREQRVLLQQGVLIGDHLHRHVRAAEELGQVLLDPRWRHPLGVCATYQ